ncbi:hypothetical protein H5P28_11430 [Ruficoccus amylovorans]|uniref:Uncharacterized protein n=1 Tax=Ruficoccus amylovorans TaxID=1804625 RepID=A0A842HF70_9BACT|nr:hypothetical protein [Ruficoccus amylovorans]MBC2594870.1 hypothetical protein [Ruficoccus amylovorans]
MSENQDDQDKRRDEQRRRAERAHKRAQDSGEPESEMPITPEELINKILQDYTNRADAAKQAQEAEAEARRQWEQRQHEMVSGCLRRSQEAAQASKNAVTRKTWTEQVPAETARQLDEVRESARLWQWKLFVVLLFLFQLVSVAGLGLWIYHVDQESEPPRPQSFREIFVEEGRE